MRVVYKEADLEESFARAQSEAKSAFGDGTVFIEKYVERPRHIEVQILGDQHGNVTHLFERDCSIQRRHQKVVEVAPAVNLPEATRRALYDDSVRLARHVRYRSAGTVEFLVDQAGQHYFIEVNPRIQVEHTITEEITGIDIVAAQLAIAGGAKLQELGLLQDSVGHRGFAIQCRVTTENPQDGFKPDTGKIQVYRSTGGNGIRLDGGPGHQGAFISHYYDSLLVKVTARAPSYPQTIRKLQRALAEFRIRGVRTNISFLLRVLAHPDFARGAVPTTFIDENPGLFVWKESLNRAQKLLNYLGDLVVNGSRIQGQLGPPGNIEPMKPTLAGLDPLQTVNPCETGWRHVLMEKGPAAFAHAIRKHPSALIMDTTWRDAHQSLLMTRVRTTDLTAIATLTSHALRQAFSLEMWGGATFDVALRFLHECPWDRLDQLRALCPNVPFQMLLRGASAVGYSNYPDNVVVEFVKEAKKHGVDIFRVFDALNYVDNLKVGMDAIAAAGGVIEAAICYTGLFVRCLC